MDSIFNLFDALKAKNIAIITHINGDPDAICGAAALKELIEKKIPKIKCSIFSDQWTDLSANIIKKLELNIEKEPCSETFDTCILFDVNNLPLLGKFSELIDPQTEIIIIDHHSIYPELEKLTKKFIIKQDYTSASEIIYDQFILNDIIMSPKIALLILIGIAFDSRHFHLANRETFKKVAHLCDLGANIDEMKTLLSKPMEYPEKIARIKAAQRSKIKKVGNWVVTFSNVSSYEASACRGLIELGADITFVIAKEKDKIRISGRSTNEFFQQAKIHLGEDVMLQIGEYIGGNGGGHATAAACRGHQNADDVFSKILDILEKKLIKKRR
ncbi:MAG: DHH family phosphoesterase [Candidatus Helarchaeota archaeon]